MTSDNNDNIEKVVPVYHICVYVCIFPFQEPLSSELLPHRIYLLWPAEGNSSLPTLASELSRVLLRENTEVKCAEECSPLLGVCLFVYLVSAMLYVIPILWCFVSKMFRLVVRVDNFQCHDMLFVHSLK